MTRRLAKPTAATQEAIECAIAKYGTVTRAAALGGFPLPDVWKVWGRMCELNAGKEQLLPCGTAAAHARHVKAGEEPCDPCTEARRNADRMRSRRRNQVAA